MERIIRWGILGCGKIARKFANDLKLVQGAELVAVASRNADNAEAFRNQHGATVAFNSYEALAQYDGVDVIYIATPHGFHHEHTMLCLKNKKAVLCEKAFALNAKQVKEMIALARQHTVFLMEAFWTRFLPQFRAVKTMLAEGTIGDVKLVQADFGFRAPENPAQRLFDPLLGGGSLLDIGLYPVFLAISILGKPVEVKAMITPNVTGVDEQCVMLLKFRDGALAVLSSTFVADTPVEAFIAGTKGRIQMRNRFHNSISRLQLISGKDDIRDIEVIREEGYGYQFEARHVCECLRNGLTESPEMTHQLSLDLIETLDRIRAACGIKYDVD